MNKLTLDAVMAHRCGVSYGKYKALHYNTEEKEKKEEPAKQMGKYIKTCVVCGDQFRTNYSNKICCSRECSAEKNRQRNRENKRKKLRINKENKEGE